MRMDNLWAGILIIFASAMLQGLSGFGFSILAVPLITMLIEPKTAIPVLLVYSIIINLAVLSSTRKSVNPGKYWILLAAGAAGLPLGGYLLVILDGNILKIMIGSLIIVFGLLLLLGYRTDLKKEKLYMIPIGLFSGILGSSISISGPPIIIFLANKQLEKNSFRGNLALYFLLLNLLTIPVFFYYRLFTPSVAAYTVSFLPGLLAGVLLGNLLSDRIRQEHFRKFTLILLLIMGFLAIFSAINQYSN